MIFNWLSKKEEVNKCEDCKSKSKVSELEDKLNKLQREINKTYIKDVLKNTYYDYEYNLMELIEKDGKKEVYIYKPEAKASDLFYPYFTATKTSVYTEGVCIEIRDFLLKNFPLEEPKEE